MKKTVIIALLTFLISANAAQAQDKKEKKTEIEKGLEKSKKRLVSKLDIDPYLQINTAPEKWKDESAVILLDYHNIQRVYEGSTKPKGKASREYTLQRILIQDQFAVNDFSEFRLYPGVLLEITVIKPNGDKIILDKSKAVSGEIRLEDYIGINPFRMTSKEKIPVPGLEPGDIIEIEAFYENLITIGGSLMRGGWYRSYDTELLGKDYPVYYKLMDFDLDEDVQLAWKSMNGAPAIETLKKKKNEYHYRFVDSVRNRIKGEFWSPGTVTLPYIKYNLASRVYSSDGGVHEFHSPFGEILSGINEEHIKTLVYSLYRLNEEETHSNIIREFVLHHRGEKMDDETYVNRFYEYYRAHYHFRVADEYTDVKNNLSFILIMKRILEKRKLEYDFVVAIPRTLGKLDDILSVREVLVGLRVRETGQIIQLFNVYSSMGELSSNIYGGDIYVATPAKKRSRILVEKEQLPSLGKEANKFNYEIHAQLLPGFEKIKVEREVELQGIAKYVYFDDMPYSLFERDFKMLWGDNYLSLGGIYPEYYDEMDPDEYKEEATRRDTAFLYELNKNAYRKLKRSHSNKYYQIEEYESFELIADGRSFERENLKYKEIYTIEGICGNAGNYYIVDIGRLLGQQMELMDSEDTIRTQDIYFGYPRVIRYRLRFELPAGMQAEGLEDFNINVSNETGSYVITAKQEGNVLVFEAVKEYNGILYEKKEWPKVKAFVDAAAELNSKRIILKR